jgi:hypothetical protein
VPPSFPRCGSRNQRDHRHKHAWFTMGSLQALHEALFKAPLWSVWGNTWCHQALVNTNQELEEMINTSMFGFTTSSLQALHKGLCQAPLWIVYGELTVPPCFTQHRSGNRREDEYKAGLVTPWFSYKHFMRYYSSDTVKYLGNSWCHQALLNAG